MQEQTQAKTVTTVHACRLACDPLRVNALVLAFVPVTQTLVWTSLGLEDSGMRWDARVGSADTISGSPDHSPPLSLLSIITVWSSPVLFTRVSTYPAAEYPYMSAASSLVFQCRGSGPPSSRSYTVVTIYNSRCHFEQQSMPFPTTVDAISNNSQYHFQQQSMPFPTTVNTISNNSRCHFQQQSMPFPTTVDAISNNSRCHLQQQSFPFPTTVDVISDNSRCHFQQQSMPLVIQYIYSKKSVNGIESSCWCMVVYMTRMLAVTGLKHGNSYLQLIYRVAGEVVVYRTRMLAVTSSKHGSSFIYVLLRFFLKFFYSCR